MPSSATDPRPLVGEPLSVDLVNTVWRDSAGEHDLLGDQDGLLRWLAGRGLGQTPATEDARLVLVAAREALRRHLAGLVAPPAPAVAGAELAAAEAELNQLLTAGRLGRSLEGGVPVTRPVVADPVRLAAWTAAEDYLQLLERGPDRLRRCANPECVLHFFDISKRGDRRWCSMAGCGNRAKAARHYARRRQG